MNKPGPVVVIQDDVDDQEMLVQVFKNLGYEHDIIFFGNGQEALDYLNSTEIVPFLVLSDINLPKLNGFKLREKIKEDARLEMLCIPYLFFTTASNKQSVIDAYSASVQGFFVKKTTLKEMEETIDAIMRYWTLCSSPNNS